MENKGVWREDPGDLNYSNGGDDIDEHEKPNTSHWIEGVRRRESI